MPRYAAEGLDLSRLPPPQAVRALDYEALLAARRARLKAAFDAAGVAYDAARLDSDPAMILQQVDAYRELLGLGMINDAVRATMGAFATGGDLDHWVLRFGIQRMAGESDDRLRWRGLLAPEAWSVGKLAGYLQAALTAHADVADAGVWVDRSDPLQPVVRIAPKVAAGGWLDTADAFVARRVRAPDAPDGTPSIDILDAVRIFVNREDAKAATDVVAVQPPVIIPYEISVVVRHRRGPDPVALRAAAATALIKLAGERNAPGRAVPLSAVTAAALPPAAEAVRVLAPAVDIPATEGQLTFCTAITVATEVVDG